MSYLINKTASIEAQQKHQNWRLIWDNMNNSVIWGCVTYLYKKYGCPNTYQDFYNAYINDTEGDNPRTHGRSEEYIRDKAQEFKDKTWGNEGLGVYMAYICKKLFFDTMDGLKWENDAKDYLSSKGFICEEPTYEQDTREGIDKLVYDKEGNLKFLLQVKPKSFFIGNNNEGLIRDRIGAIVKEKLTSEKYGVPTIFFIYDKTSNNWVKNQKGNYGFLLKYLIDKDGYTINQY